MISTSHFRAIRVTRSSFKGEPRKAIVQEYDEEVIMLDGEFI